MNTATKPKLRWGILGTAQVNEKILPHFAKSKLNDIVAVASRDLKKARAEADRWVIDRAYGSYEELLADPGIDVVYISLPNHLHFEWARNALQAGKHVLCEKPLALQESHAKALTAAAFARDLRIAEGYMYRHHAQTRRILELVRSGTIGEVRRVQGSFHITIPPGPNIRTNAKLGGGALFDVGCYLTNFANAIVGRSPIALSTYGRLENPGTPDAYDVLFSALLNYGDGITAQLDGGFLGPRIDEMQILGSGGWLEIPHPFKPGKRETLTIHRRPTRESPVTTELIEIIDEEDPYARELENFAAYIQNGDPFPIEQWEYDVGVATIEKIRGLLPN